MIFLGILIGFGLFAIVEINYKTIKLLIDNKKSKEVVEEVAKTYEKPKENKLTREELEKQEEIKKHFDNLMKYDYETALRKE